MKHSCSWNKLKTVDSPCRCLMALKKHEGGVAFKRQRGAGGGRRPSCRGRWPRPPADSGYCAHRASLLDNQSGRVAAASCHASNGPHMERPRGTDAVINSGAPRSSCPPLPQPHWIWDQAANGSQWWRRWWRACCLTCCSAAQRLHAGCRKQFKPHKEQQGDGGWWWEGRGAGGWAGSVWIGGEMKETGQIRGRIALTLTLFDCEETSQWDWVKGDSVTSEMVLFQHWHW